MTHPTPTRALVLTAIALAAVGCGTKAQDTETDRLRCVAPTGSNLNDGTCTAPWKTIQKALDRAAPGDTVLVRSGTYSERLRLTRSGLPGARIVLRAYGGETPIIRGQLRISGSYVRVAGLRIDGRGTTVPIEPLVLVSHGRHIRIERLDVIGSRHSGVFVGGGAQDIDVIGCWVQDNGTSGRVHHGISLGRGRSGSIQSNVVVGNSGGGIQIYPGFDDVLVNQNTVIRNGAFGVLVGGERDTSDQVTVVNNIVAFNGGQGIRTFWGGPIGSDNIAANNLLWGNGEDDVSREGILQRENFTASPNFVDFAAGNYRLRRRSSAVGQALLRHIAPIDRDGRPRPQGQRPDLGAYER